MNATKCLRCGRINASFESFCLQCGFSLAEMPADSQISVSPADHARALGFTPFVDTEYGRKVFFWYSVYCIFLALIYIAVAIIGVALLVIGLQSGGKEAAEATMIGVLYAVFGVIFCIPFAIAPFLPKKSWNWIYGIILICVGMTSCCFLPFTIPLLINWLKPETKALFGRK